MKQEGEVIRYTWESGMYKVDNTARVMHKNCVSATPMWLMMYKRGAGLYSCLRGHSGKKRAAKVLNFHGVSR
jgi:hypothetical protein